MVIFNYRRGNCPEGVSLQDLQLNQNGYAANAELRYDNKGRLFIAKITKLTPERLAGSNGPWAKIEKTAKGLSVDLVNVDFKKVRRGIITNSFLPIDSLLIDNVPHGHFKDGKYYCAIGDIRPRRTLQDQAASYWVRLTDIRVENGVAHSALLRSDTPVIKLPVIKPPDGHKIFPPEPEVYYEIRKNREGYFEVAVSTNPKKPGRRKWFKAHLED